MGIKDLSVLSGGGMRGWKSNSPIQYKGRQKQYFAEASALFAEQYAQYSDEFADVRMQGLDPNDFYKWAPAKVRLSDTIKQGISMTRKTDDQKEFLIPDRSISYVQEGAKVEAMGSTWLVTNPSNISGGICTGIMRRCNATWNHLDWYGNLKKEPILVEKSQAMATANDSQTTGLIMQGYFDITLQKNEDTEELDYNSRIILGRRAYQITGYSDVTQEFTDDDTSCHMLYFDARIQEPNHEIDDLELRVAGGKTFTWAVTVSGTPALTAGETAQFSAASVRCGEPVQGTDERPITYTWESLSPEIASVDPDTGLVTAHSVGTAVIRATLKENTAHTGSMEISVSAVDTDADGGGEAREELRFTSEVPERLYAYDAVTLSAAFYRGGVCDDTAPITWAFTGAKKGAYTANDDGGGKASVNVWSGSTKPLTVTASCNGHSVSAKIKLEGL